MKGASNGYFISERWGSGSTLEQNLPQTIGTLFHCPPQGVFLTKFFRLGGRGVPWCEKWNWVQTSCEFCPWVIFAIILLQIQLQRKWKQIHKWILYTNNWLLNIQFQCLVDGTALAFRHAWQKWMEVLQVEESEDEDHGIKIILRCGQGIFCRNNW